MISSLSSNALRSTLADAEDEEDESSESGLGISSEDEEAAIAGVAFRRVSSSSSSLSKP